LSERQTSPEDVLFRVRRGSVSRSAKMHSASSGMLTDIRFDDLSDCHHETTCTAWHQVLPLALHFLPNTNIKVRVSEVELQPKVGRNKTYSNLHDQNTWGRCQIWQAQDPEYVPVRPSLGPVSPRRPTGPIKTLFFSPNAFFGIPCRQNNCIVEAWLIILQYKMAKRWSAKSKDPLERMLDRR
jgi:hypothetical protein